MSSSMSPVSERAEAPSQIPVDSVKWPYEHFPSPPPDGHWIPKFGPPLPSKFPPPPSVPSKLVSLDPPIMALTYPPPPPLDAKDPTWITQMVADLMRQRAHVESCISKSQPKVTSVYAEAGLADADLQQERNQTQDFLNMIASVAGAGFIRRLLEDVDRSVEEMSKPPGNGDDSGSESPSSSTANGAHEPAP